MSETNYAEIAYNDLKKMASERGLDSRGTKDELIARLTEADGGTVPPEGGTGTPPKIENPDEDRDEPKPKSAPISGGELEKKYRTKAARIKALLDAQPKVMVFIPFEAGENAAQAAKIKQVVNINGYQFDIPRGVAVNVPIQVAEMIKERLESEGKAGRSHRIDGNPEKEEALS